MEGQDLIDQLGLADESLALVRRYDLDIIALKREHPQDPRIHRLFMQSFAYPDDTPDLTKLRPPGGNSRKGSASNVLPPAPRRGHAADVLLMRRISRKSTRTSVTSGKTKNQDCHMDLAMIESIARRAYRPRSTRLIVDV